MIEIDRGKCDLCGTCISVCSGNALKIDRELSIVQSKCVLCLRCIKVCPFGAITNTTNSAQEEENNG